MKCPLINKLYIFTPQKINILPTSTINPLPINSSLIAMKCLWSIRDQYKIRINEFKCLINVIWNHPIVILKLPLNFIWMGFKCDLNMRLKWIHSDTQTSKKNSWNKKKPSFFTFNLAFIVVPMTITIAPGLSSIVPTRSAGTSQTRHCPMISAVHTSRAKNVFLADIWKI